MWKIWLPTFLVAFLLRVRIWRMDLPYVLAHWEVVYEAALITVLLVVLCRLRVLREWWGRMPQAHRAVASLFAIATLFGQVIDVPRDTFPFVAWDMYGNNRPLKKVHFYRYVGFTAAGDEVPLNPSRLFASLGYGTMRMTFNLSSVANFALEKDNKSRYKHDPPGFAIGKKRLRLMLQAIARKHNDEHPRQQVVRIAARRHEVSIVPYDATAAPLDIATFEVQVGE